MNFQCRIVNTTVTYSAYISPVSVKCIGKTRAKLLVKTTSGHISNKSYILQSHCTLSNTTIFSPMALGNDPVLGTCVHSSLDFQMFRKPRATTHVQRCRSLGHIKLLQIQQRGIPAYLTDKSCWICCHLDMC